MSEINPVAWCLMTGDGQIINGVHTELRLAEQYRHRRASDTLTSLFTADQLAEAVAAERERCIDIVANAAPGNDCTLPAHDEAILTGLAEDIVEAIRGAAK